MSKHKDPQWYANKIDEMKKEKREILGNLKKHKGVSTDTIKKIKDDFRRTKRAYKRGEKHECKENIKKIING